MAALRLLAENSAGKTITLRNLESPGIDLDVQVLLLMTIRLHILDLTTPRIRDGALYGRVVTVGLTPPVTSCRI